MSHRVVIIGGGFAGLNAAKALRRTEVDVALVDRTSYHLFQPLLYQVATGILSEGEIAQSLRGILHRHRNVRVLLAEASEIDLDGRAVTASAPDGERLTLAYDSLIVSSGARHGYFGRDDWESCAPGLKTLDDARILRSRILGAFELAELALDPGERRAWLTFVVVGAGPTGVELSGQISELARHTLRRDYRSIDAASARIVLIDAGAAVLPSFPGKLGRRAARDLERMGVEVRVATAAIEIDEAGIDVSTAGGSRERIESRTVVWAAGVQASQFGRLLGEATGAEVDRSGRVAVRPDLTLPGHPEVFVCGDVMSLEELPGVAQVAIQQGRHAARTIAARVGGRAAPDAFHYTDKGTMATTGKLKAVARIGPFDLTGLLAAMVWALIHLTFLIGFANKLVTMVRWTLIVFTSHRSQRLIDVGSRAQPGLPP